MPLKLDRLAERVKGRKEAEVLIEWGDEVVRVASSTEAISAFYESMSEWIETIKPKPEISQSVQMNDHQGRIFADSTSMPFGIHRGKRVNDVPLKYLDWLIDAPDEFKDQLRR